MQSVLEVAMHFWGDGEETSLLEWLCTELLNGAHALVLGTESTR